MVVDQSTQWSGSFDGLPQYDVTDGHEIAYTIEEVALDGYSSLITGDAKHGFVVTNTNTAKVTVPVTKQWVGTPSTNAEIILYADGIEKDRATLTAQDEWTHEFKSLPKYNVITGNLINYTISETPIDGYKSTIKGNQNVGFTVINTKIESPINNHVDSNSENSDSSLSENTTSAVSGLPQTGDSNKLLFFVCLALTVSGVTLITFLTRKLFL